MTEEFLSENSTSFPSKEESAFASFKSIQNVVYKAMLLLICIFGISGNSMAILVIRTSYALRKLPSNFYLTALAVSSTIFLTTVFLMWLELMLNWQTFNSTNLGCKMLTFLAGFSDFSCIWLIVAVSADRMLILYWPKWRRKVWTLAVVKRAVLAILLVSVLFNSWCIFLANLVPDKESGSKRLICGIYHEHMNAYVVLHSVDMVICIIIPSVLIVVVNTVSIRKYRKYTKMQHTTATVRFRNSKDSTDLTFLPPENYQNGRQNCTNGYATVHSTPRGSKDVKKKLLRPADLKLTKIILIITTTFLCMNLPSYIFRVTLTVVNGGVIFTQHVDSLIEFVAYVLYYTHFAILFYLYIFWSPQMKKELKPAALKLLECYCLKTVPDFGHEVVNGPDSS